MLTNRITFTILLLAGMAYAFAQDLQKTNLTVEDGLPSNNVYGCIQDVKGFIWFFTDKGISKYNGSEFKTFTVQDGLQTNDVWDLSEDKQGRLWIFANGDKLQYILDDKILDVVLTQPLNKKGYYSSSFYINRVEFSINQNDIYVVENDTLKVIPEGLLKDNKNLLATYPVPIYLNLDTINIGSLPNKYVIPISHRQHEFRKSNLRSNGDIKSFNLENITLKSGEKIYHFILLTNSKTSEIVVPNFYEYFNQLPDHAYISNMDDYIEIQTNLGTLVYNQDLKLVNKLILKELNLTYNLNKAFIDKNGNSWICTQDKGVVFIKAQNKGITSIDCLRDKNIIKIFEDKGRMFYCDNKGNIYYISKNTCQLLLNINSIKSERLQSNVRDSKIYNIVPYKGKYILTTKYDVLLLDIENRKIENLINAETKIDASKFSPVSIRDALHYERLDAFIFAYSGGLTIWSKNDPTVEPETIFEIAANRILAKSETELYIGTNQGLISLDLKTMNFEKLFEEDFNGKITDLIYLDSILFIGTDGYGLAYIVNDQLFFVNSMQREIISDIQIIDESVWVTSNNGINVFSLNSNKKLTHLKKISKSNGLLSNEVQCLYIQDQFIYAGFKSGVNKIIEKDSSLKIHQPYLYHTSTLVNNEEIQLSKEYKFNNTQNNIRFNFEGISFKEINSLQYEYTLTGDIKNTTRSIDNTTSYFNLAPGNYTFTAHSIDVEGMKSSYQFLFDFTITQPWHKKTSTVVFGLLILSILSFLYYKKRIKNVQEAAKEQTITNKKFADLELQALRSQMNPHFLFNCMNTIQYLIDSNQSAQASDYLNQFAALMRLYLESSKESVLYLEDELQLLENYLSLEQLRFDGNFTYQITADPKLRNSMIKIPSMMIQPFVENAIVHGLFHKSGDKFLSIDFQSFSNNQIRCIIEDNGVGRDKAEKIKAKFKGKHKSRGIQIIKERILLLQENGTKDISIEFEDLLNEKLEVSGTRVNLNITITDQNTRLENLSNSNRQSSINQTNIS